MAASTIAPIAIAIPPKPRTGPEWRDKGGEATPLLLAGASERERRVATWIPQPLTRRLLVRKTIRIMSLSDARKARAETALNEKKTRLETAQKRGRNMKPNRTLSPRHGAPTSPSSGKTIR